MPRIVAFEGNPRPATGVSWGAAAIEQGDVIVNAVSRLAMPRSEFVRLVLDGTLVELPTSQEVDERHSHSPIIGLKVDRRAPFYSKVAELTPSKLALSRAPREAVVVLFQDMESFRESAKRINSWVANELLSEQPETKAADALISAGLTLNLSDAVLNAIWATQHEGKEFVYGIARQHVARMPEGIPAFEELCTELRRAHQTNVKFVYSGGEANQGFDLSTFQLVITNLQKLFASAVYELEQLYSFVTKDRVPQLKSQFAGSVGWEFDVSKVPTLAERLTARLIWKRVVKVLRDPPSQHDVTLYPRQIVISPSEGTTLTINDAISDYSFEILGRYSDVIRWAKRLSRSDAQVPGEGSAMPYLRFTKGNLTSEEDQYKWFRDEMFRALDWRASAQYGQDSEAASLKCSVTIDGLFLGEQEFELSHRADRRLAKGAPTTWLHWNGTLRSILESGFYALHWAVVERRGTQYYLSIDIRRPNFGAE